MVIPRILLKFCEGKSTCRLNYSIQFPVLEMVRISRDNKSQYFGERLTEQEYFETSVSFLYNFFLHGTNSRGLSVKYLDVPFPPGDKFRLTTNAIGCECRKGFCECFEWKDSSEFWDRVVTVFPNLVSYQAMEDSWKRVRTAMVKERVELWERLWFVGEFKEEEMGENQIWIWIMRFILKFWKGLGL